MGDLGSVAVAEAEFQRIVLLNRLITRSVTRAPEPNKAPAHGALDLLKIIEKRREKKLAIEFLGALDDDDEMVRAKNGAGFNFLRLRQCRFEECGTNMYAILLMEFVDQSVRSFPVVNTKDFSGREISGDDEERGATAAHVVVRMPLPGTGFDDGSYRCALETVSPITRRDVEGFLSRQTRRADDWTFSVDTIDKAGKKITRSYQYHPKFNLFADIGRKMNTLTDGRVLNYMLFTKRAEKQSIAKPTAAIHNDVYADVELKISARQGPDDTKEQQTWTESLRQAYKARGFDSRLYYRHINGGVLSGEIHQAVDGAADIMMCPKEIITLKKNPKRWTSTINAEIATGMIALLDRGELWELSK
jgi:hypothetical protein